MAGRRLIVSTLAALAFSAAANSSQPVWIWNDRCGASALLITLTLDGHRAYQIVVPICRRSRPQDSDWPAKSTVSFSFAPARAIAWHSYRDREDVAAADAPLAIELSEVSADASTLVLAIVASDPVSKAIYMKTIHVAQANKDSATDIARGLTIDSHPYSLSSR